MKILVFLSLSEEEEKEILLCQNMHKQWSKKVLFFLSQGNFWGVGRDFLFRPDMHWFRKKTEPFCARVDLVKKIPKKEITKRTDPSFRPT